MSGTCGRLVGLGSGLNIKAKSKMTFNPEIQMILGPTVGNGRMSDDTKQSLAEQAPYYCSNWGCVVLCYDPHDKYALDFLDDLLVIVNQVREEHMKPYMPFKIIVVGINSRPLEVTACAVVTVLAAWGS